MLVNGISTKYTLYTMFFRLRSLEIGVKNEKYFFLPSREVA